MAKKIIIAGIGTDVGKTVVSAVLVKAMGADYWKPVQCGLERDSEKIQALVPGAFCHKESYCLASPTSPHEAAAAAGVLINNLVIPQHEKPLIIELAGGLMVPLRTDWLFMEWAKEMEAEWVLVSRYYLGSINHTLLSAAALQGQKVSLALVGERNEASKEAILARTKLPLIMELPEAPITPEQITLWSLWI